MRRAARARRGALTPSYPTPSIPLRTNTSARPSSTASAVKEDGKRRAALSKWDVNPPPESSQSFTSSGPLHPGRATSAPSSRTHNNPLDVALDSLMGPKAGSKQNASGAGPSNWLRGSASSNDISWTGQFAARSATQRWPSTSDSRRDDGAFGPGSTARNNQRRQEPDYSSALNPSNSPFEAPQAFQDQRRQFRVRDEERPSQRSRREVVDLRERASKWLTRPSESFRTGLRQETPPTQLSVKPTAAGSPVLVAPDPAFLNWDADRARDDDPHTTREGRRAWKDGKSHKLGKERGSLLDPRYREEEDVDYQGEAVTQARKKAHKLKEVQAVIEKDLFIPSIVSVGNLARILGIRHKELLRLMQTAGMEHRNTDHLLSAEDASLLAMELGFNPVVDDEAAFDIYPEPAHPQPSTLPHRPPIVTIMGHVDHGKTTLLDTLRSASVAKGEAGGITQHIGAFSVPVKTATSNSGIRTITFLDTPGHAAFTAMRARGASVTDIIVCVVAADDGVMPQTKEVLELAKREEKVQLVIAINKVDMPGVDVDKVKNELLREGVQLEEFAGDVPCVEVSGLTGQGLDNLIETLSVMAEVADLRAEQDSKAEGYVLESQVDKGRGPISTVLVMRGVLKSGGCIVAGTTWCKVRQMVDDKGRSVREALPGTPVTIAGWKDVPIAGDEVLEAVRGEDDAKKAVENRQRELEKRTLLEDVEKINEKRREERHEREEELAAKENGAEMFQHTALAEEGPRELRLIVKADVSGSVEAVVGALQGIGNDEVTVRIVAFGVGDVNENDVVMAETAQGMIVGFNVAAGRATRQQADAQGVSLYIDDVIYRVMEEIRKRASALLPPAIEKHVKGEATIQQVFNVTMKKKTEKVAGCRVTNGAIDSKSRVRVVRLGEPVWEGMLAELKHMKKEITEARKGMECGMFFKGFLDFQEGDTVQAIQIVEVPRTL